MCVPVAVRASAELGSPTITGRGTTLGGPRSLGKVKMINIHNNRIQERHILLLLSPGRWKGNKSYDAGQVNDLFPIDMLS